MSTYEASGRFISVIDNRPVMFREWATWPATTIQVRVTANSPKEA